MQSLAGKGLSIRGHAAMGLNTNSSNRSSSCASHNHLNHRPGTPGELLNAHYLKTIAGKRYTLTKGSNVVPFWVCYGFLVKDYNVPPKKELHRRVWVASGHGRNPRNGSFPK